MSQPSQAVAIAAQVKSNLPLICLVASQNDFFLLLCHDFISFFCKSSLFYIICICCILCAYYVHESEYITHDTLHSNAIHTIHSDRVLVHYISFPLVTYITRGKNPVYIRYSIAGA